MQALACLQPPPEGALPPDIMWHVSSGKLATNDENLSMKLGNTLTVPVDDSLWCKKEDLDDFTDELFGKADIKLKRKGKSKKIGKVTTGLPRRDKDLAGGRKKKAGTARSGGKKNAHWRNSETNASGNGLKVEVNPDGGVGSDDASPKSSKKRKTVLNKGYLSGPTTSFQHPKAQVPVMITPQPKKF